MRVFQLHNRYRRAGGEDSVVKAEASVLRDAGHTVSQYIVANPDGVVAATAKLAISAWNPLSAREVSRLVEEHSPDVAHVHNTWFSLSAGVIAAISKLDVPTVVTLHNYRPTCLNGRLFRNGSICTICLGRSPTAGVRYRCYRGSTAASSVAWAATEIARRTKLWSNHVDIIVVTTEFARKVFIEAGFPPKKLVIKPHFVDDGGRRYVPPSLSSTVVYVGRLDAEKGIDVLADAWEEATSGGLKLVVIGDGPLRPELSDRLGDEVEFLGWIPSQEVRNHMLSARALLFPSVWHETFGVVLLEAMASGLPIIASDVGGVRNILGALSNEWLLPPGEVGALVEAISLLDAGDTLDSYGKRLRERYLETYSRQIGLEQLLTVYESAIAGAS